MHLSTEPGLICKCALCTQSTDRSFLPSLKDFGVSEFHLNILWQNVLLAMDLNEK